MTIINDKTIVDTALPRDLSFYPGSTDTEQAVIDTDAANIFKWVISNTNGDIVIETSYGTFIYYPASAVTPGGFLPVANGKKIVSSHNFGGALGTKNTTPTVIYLYGGV